MNCLYSHPIRFRDLKVGEYFEDEGTVYEKLSEELARGPKTPLGSGIYDFDADDWVQEEWLPRRVA